MKNRVLDENGYPIDHASMRFRKVISVPKVPKPEEMLRRAEKWRPWRSVASWYLWASLRVVPA